MMINRQLIGDFTLALALVLPTAAIAGSDLPSRQPTGSTSAVVAKAAHAERTMAERGVGLLG